MTAGVRTHAGACGFEHTCLYLTRAKGVWGERTRLQVPYTHMGHGWGGGCTGAYLFFSLSEVFKEVLPVNRFRDPIGRPCSEQPRSADAFARTVPRTEGKKRSNTDHKPFHRLKGSEVNTEVGREGAT